MISPIVTGTMLAASVVSVTVTARSTTLIPPSDTTPLYSSKER